jgi:hypothetical protein
VDVSYLDFRTCVYKRPKPRFHQIQQSLHSIRFHQKFSFIIRPTPLHQIRDIHQKLSNLASRQWNTSDFIKFNSASHEGNTSDFIKFSNHSLQSDFIKFIPSSRAFAVINFSDFIKFSYHGLQLDFIKFRSSSWSLHYFWLCWRIEKWFWTRELWYINSGIWIGFSHLEVHYIHVLFLSLDLHI